MKIAVIYSSVTGNTKELAGMIHRTLVEQIGHVDIFHVNEFPLSELATYKAIAVGTYTWGNGDIPKEMEDLYLAFTKEEKKRITTAVFGTGDSFYPHFCGAVERFRDMLYVHTSLAVTLKVELMPQFKDYNRCMKFTESFIHRLKQV